MNTKKISLSNSEKIGFLQSLSTMLESGISILEAIDALLEESKGKYQKFLVTVKEDIMQGNHLYYSFAKFPLIFDKVAINLIKAAEEAGALEVTLNDLRVNIQKEIEFSDKIKSALIYPIMIGIVFMGVLLLILIIVVPKISSVFSRLKMDLPLPTKVLIFVSNLLIHNTLQFILGLTIFCFVFIFIFKKNKQLILSPLMSLPVISELVKSIDLTRFSRNLSILLHAGIPIIMALELSKDIVINKEMGKVISRSIETVISGKKLSEGFKTAKKIIPNIMIKLMEVGEKSGALEKSMQDISIYLDYQVSNSLKTLTALIEPVMLIIVGVAVGAMMMAIIAPIYNMIGQVGMR